MMKETKRTYILNPGWTRSSRSYKRFVDARPDDAQVVIASHSQVLPSGLITEYLNNLARLLDQLDTEQIGLMGHSAGGALALEYALQTQDPRVRELVLICSSGVDGRETPMKLFNNWLQNIIDSDDKVVRGLQHFADPWRVMMHYRIGKFASRADFLDRVPNLNMPVTIFAGDRDVMNPAWQAELLHHQIPQSRLFILPGGHDVIVRQPKKIWTHLQTSTENNPRMLQ